MFVFGRVGGLADDHGFVCADHSHSVRVFICNFQPLFVSLSVLTCLSVLMGLFVLVNLSVTLFFLSV